MRYLERSNPIERESNMVAVKRCGEERMESYCLIVTDFTSGR